MEDQDRTLKQRTSGVSRREFLRGSIAAAAIASLPRRANAAENATKPNILFIITDHHAFYAHDRQGQFEYKWPVFEKFCNEGIRFDRAYSVCPLCTPARASMLTGVYPSSHGLMRNTDYADMHDFRDGQKLYTDYLSQAGYRNAYVGKWHCGKNKLAADFGMEGWSLPDYGKVYMSDVYKSYAAQRQLGDARARIEYDLYHPGWNGKTLTLHHPSPWRFMNASGVLIGPPEAHEENFVAHLAVQKLRELAKADQPWSLVASFWGPHQPYFPTEPYASRVQPKTIPEYPTFNDDLQGRPLRYILHRDFSHPSRQAWPEWSIWQKILARAYGQGYQTDAAKETDHFENIIAAGYKAILFNPTDADGSIANVKKAKQAGMPTFCMDREINSTDVAVAQILSDNYSGCVKLGQYFVKKLNKEGTYVVTILMKGRVF